MIATLVLQAALLLRRPDGVRLSVSNNPQPELLVTLPGRSEPAIEILFPEHVTARAHGRSEAEHLYLPSLFSKRPVWRKVGASLQYERDLLQGVHFLARATLQDDGILFHYELTNGSATDWDMITVVTDPRMHWVLHDVRLERTYVHHPNGFDLLASETPQRLTMPLYRWLPARYLASYRWPVPAPLVQRRADATYYNKSLPVDEPLIATVSSDHKWIVASFTRDTGNVWSNPELTCQHVDPQIALPARQKATVEIKVLIMHGRLADVQRTFLRERDALR